MIVNVDTGGTHTDAYLLDERQKRLATGKAPTTDYDLSVGFMNAIEQAASRWDMDLLDVFDRAEMIKYSTTTGVNAIVEGTGPRLGLITTRGFEDVLYTGKSRNWADGLPRERREGFARAERPEMLVPRELRVGVRERVDSTGEVIMPLGDAEVREQVRYLVDEGVRGFVVNLLWSHENPVHERRIKRIIEEEYPETYLGNMPVLLSSEVSPKIEEYTRAVTTILNGQMANTAEEHFIDLNDELQRYDYTGPLFAVRNVGGVASVSRTAPLHLYDAGPVAGVMGAQYLGRLYDEPNVLATDMGGTSFDLGMVLENRERIYEFNPVIDRWRFQLSLVETTSIGAGGGSIASVNDVGELTVGPQSAGSDPGPACYGQGGSKPTVTDADVVLGYLNPDYFLGGRKQLSERRAERAIRRHVADPLDRSVEDAAYRIRELVDGTMGQEIYKQTAMRGHDPKQFALFAFGGAGPVHACNYADYVDVSKIVTFPFGSVFNAFGAATMDIFQTYEEATHLTLYDPHHEEYTEEYDRFNQTVDRLLEQARRDIKEEGFSANEASFTLELDCVYASQLHPTRCVSPVMELSSKQDVKAVCDAFNETYSENYSSGATFPSGGIRMENIKLNAVVEFDDPQLPTRDVGESNSVGAKTGSREVFWSPDSGYQDTRVYEHEQLTPGDTIAGPAIIDARGTTYVVSPEKKYRIDEYGNGVMT